MTNTVKLWRKCWFSSPHILLGESYIYQQDNAPHHKSKEPGNGSLPNILSCFPGHHEFRPQSNWESLGHNDLSIGEAEAHEWERNWDLLCQVMCEECRKSWSTQCMPGLRHVTSLEDIPLIIRHLNLTQTFLCNFLIK